MIMKKTLFLAALAAGSLTAMPAQAFFCSNFFGKSNRQPPPQIASAYSFYPQQLFYMPYGIQPLYSPLPQTYTPPTNGWIIR